MTPSSSAPSYPNDLDIRATITQQPDNGKPVPRPRGNGKLLSSMNGVGLALLRLEHVEGVEKGGLKLEFDVESGESQGTWAASHWWPNWWPQRPE